MARRPAPLAASIGAATRPAVARAAVALGTVIAATIAGAGCDSGAPTGGGDGAVSSVVLPTCAFPRRVDAVVGDTVSVMLDTRGGGSFTGTLGGTCGPGDPLPPAVVLEIVVPGVGTHAVEISTANVGTDRTFDTVMAVRRYGCDDLYAQRCFDDRDTERRARGTVLAEGGETLWVIVTGYPNADYVDRGPLQIDVTARVERRPTIESASVLVTPGGVRATLTGGDPDADGAGTYLTFHGPAGELLDLDGDGDTDTDDYLWRDFDRSVAGALQFTETTTFDGVTAPAGAREAWVRVFDSAGAVSEIDVAVPLRSGEIVGSGAACDDSHVCGSELECRTMVCQATAERAVSCAAASPIAVPAPMGQTTSAMVEGVLGPGLGLFGASACGSTVGREAIHTVTVPDVGRFDVIATTDLPGTPADADTVVYARADCVDPETESGCADDITYPENARSTLEVLDALPGTLAIFVERWGGVPEGTMLRYALQVSLRPVLDAGASCDPRGQLDRCAGGACPASTRVCP